MMQKTLKKSKHDGSEKAKSFTFTENGLVENEDNPENKVVAKRKEHKSLLDSVTEIEVTKKRLKDETIYSTFYLLKLSSMIICSRFFQFLLQFLFFELFRQNIH